MNLLGIVERSRPPEPWSEGEKIPWNDPDFSARMLAEHLSQAHDAASRRTDLLEAQVAWIHRAVLGERVTRILDLGCGPGLYTSRLAKLGHTCTGIDFGPASVAYARQEAAARNLPCTYHLADIRRADYGAGYGLAMLLFGEFNVFRREDARLILGKVHAALEPGGWLLLEPHTLAAVAEIGGQPPRWSSRRSGLFSPLPHLLLEEAFWDDEGQIATERYFVIDAAGGEVSRHAASMQGYSPEAYRALLAGCGFTDIQFHPSISGGMDERQSSLCGITARRAG